MKTGQKHLIKCRCVLPQFKKLQSPPPHHFPVFSIVDNEKVIQKYAQCNNCGIIHRVIDICTSEFVQGKDHMNSLIKIEDIKSSIHQNIVNVLESNSADLPTWEYVQFVIENKQWGSFAILATEQDSEEINGKYVRILSESLCKVEAFSRSSGVVR